MRIEIGGGTIPKQGYQNLDPAHGKGVWKRMAQGDPWPVGDNTVDDVRASHVMEHVAAGADRIQVMNEAHRVLKPGRLFEIIVPLIMVRNEMVQGWWAWSDPTHISQWVYPESFLYFCDGAFRANADYGIRYWAPLDESICEVRNGWEGVVRLRKP